MGVRALERKMDCPREPLVERVLAKFKPGMTTEDLRKIWAYR